MNDSHDLIPIDEKKDEIPDEEAARMSFTGHLGELRTRMVHTTIILVILFFVGFSFADEIMAAIRKPVDIEGIEWVTLLPLESFLVKIKISLFAAIALGAPYIGYQICAFVFPGLKHKEKYVIKIALAASSCLALLGMMTAFFIILRFVFPQLLAFAPDWVTTQLQLGETMTFIIKIILGFGLAFQFPIAILVAVYLDLVTPKVLKEQRKIAIVVIMVVAAILTPPEPTTMFLMSAPLLILYEVSIILSHLVVRRRVAHEDTEES